MKILEEHGLCVVVLLLLRHCAFFLPVPGMIGKAIEKVQDANWLRAL